MTNIGLMDYPSLPPFPKRPKNVSKPHDPLPYPTSLGISTSSIPCSPTTLQKQWVKDTYKPLDMTKILGSPHNIPKGFKEWLPTFSGEDSTMTKNHSDSFINVLEPYDQYEYVLMKIFSYSLIKKSKELYNNISPREITN
jgi:hypothetical protein